MISHTHSKEDSTVVEIRDLLKVGFCFQIMPSVLSLHPTDRRSVTYANTQTSMEIC